MEIRTLSKLNTVVTLPGSKSYTQRALVIAALSEGRSILHHALVSEDTAYLIEALRLLGASIEMHGDAWHVKGTAGHIVPPGQELYLGNNGTAIRLLTGVASLGEGEFRLTGDSRLCERPIGPLLGALRDLGVDASAGNGRGCPPVLIRSTGLKGGHAVLRNIPSSQFVSSLLVVSPMAKGDSMIEVEGRIPSRPYVDLTLETIRDFGVDVKEVTSQIFQIGGNQRYRAISYAIEGDASTASYFFLAAVVCRGTVRVNNINPWTLQGDIALLDVMERLGVKVVRRDRYIEVSGGDLYQGDYVFDFGTMPDVVPTFAVMSALRKGRTVIRNVSQLRMKESDRLAALVNELQRVGISTDEYGDCLVIEGGHPHGALIETYNDHRIAMSFAILGLAVPGITIADRSCVNKSYPGFWEELDKWY